jgi:hypothetical protein
MKNRKQLIFRIILIATPILFAIAAIPIIYGWYVSTIRTGKIDGSTKNVSISYTLDNGRTSKTNVLTYTIDNLVFFDIENTDETAFFNSMAVNLELKLTNTSNSDMTYTVTFNTTKRIVNGDNEEAVSISYVACYFSNIPNNYAANTKISSLETNTTSYAYTNNSTSYSAVYSSDEYALKASTPENTNDEATLNLYLIGVQEISTAKNTDFLYTESNGVKRLIEYQFSITITGVPKSDSQATEITTTEETTTE